ncbi:plasmid partitioning protein RepB C-terminal domain-containing protein [Hydrogenophaga sp.]|uniref:plasmid partitioning protein RepB C-terminal domain-containing protein n=1 Tax=Hydrogenophaga sp. TaxID=1904254 RepID=UPI0025C0C1BE|nr:plasmid partitioning protein RepB C-terminal domain-containing protein [Hydrogenophaga sp.]
MASTSSEMLVNPRRTGRAQAATQEQIAKLERETANLHERYRIVEQNYGDDVLSLSLVRGYIKKLLENQAIAGFLQKRHPDFLQEFNALAQVAALDQ